MYVQALLDVLIQIIACYFVNFLCWQSTFRFTPSYIIMTFLCFLGFPDWLMVLSFCFSNTFAFHFPYLFVLLCFLRHALIYGSSLGSLFFFGFFVILWLIVLYFVLALSLHLYYCFSFTFCY